MSRYIDYLWSTPAKERALNEDDDRPRPQTEQDFEEMLCYLLESEGISYRRQVRTGCGIADVVTADTVYEVKLELTRPVLFKALGQVTMYAAALRKPRRVIFGRQPDSDDFEELRRIVHLTGVRINAFPSKRDEHNLFWQVPPWCSGESQHEARIEVEMAARVTALCQAISPVLDDPTFWTDGVPRRVRVSEIGDT